MTIFVLSSNNSNVVYDKFSAQIQKEEDIFQDHPELQKLFEQFKSIKIIKTHHILVLFLRLRQICNHPCLINGVCTCFLFYLTC